jgi:hypothetical protein
MPSGLAAPWPPATLGSHVHGSQSPALIHDSTLSRFTRNRRATSGGVGTDRGPYLTLLISLSLVVGRSGWAPRRRTRATRRSAQGSPGTGGHMLDGPPLLEAHLRVTAEIRPGWGQRPARGGRHHRWTSPPAPIFNRQPTIPPALVVHSNGCHDTRKQGLSGLFGDLPWTARK